MLIMTSWFMSSLVRSIIEVAIGRCRPRRTWHLQRLRLRQGLLALTPWWRQELGAEKLTRQRACLLRRISQEHRRR